MDKLEEARKLAIETEVQQDELDAKERELAALSSPWNDTIERLHELIRVTAEARDMDPLVQASKAGLALLEQRLVDLKNELYGIAVGLVDVEAFFPSGKKSQVLTDRITLKSQMPGLPTVVDPMTLVEALVTDRRLREFAKGVSVKLDNDVAEAIMRWWVGREDGDVGLEAPQPKILNIKVKPKEETE